MPFIPDLGDSIPPPAQGTVYAVDIGGLSDFAGFVQQEFDGEFEPSKQRVDLDTRSALLWGSGLPGDLVMESRTSCAQSHGRMLCNLGIYLNTGTAIVDVIQQLMDVYTSADELAAMSPESMLADLASALNPHRSVTAVKADAGGQPE